MRIIVASILLSFCLGPNAWAQLPDLVANGLRLRETNLRVGSLLQLSFRIKNQGTSSAAASRARVFLSSNTSIVNAPLLSELSIPALAAQEETPAIDYIFSIPYNTTTGNKNAILRLDATNLVTEQNEVNDFVASNTLTILPDFSVEQHLPYPILLIHGLGSDYRTWDSLKNTFQHRFGWSYGGNMNFCLNQDGNLATGNKVIDYRDWTNVASLRAADFYTANFNVGMNGQDVSATNPSVQSNQAAIVKQGLAVRDAIKHILQVTGKDKVVLLGHSMGGLASREYLQNSSNWQAEGRHHVAKLATLGTPHGGSNSSGWGLSGLAGIDERSEAVRDLRYDYFYSGAPGVYLFGGQESNSVLSNFLFSNYYNVDVNGDGVVGTPVVGLNQKILPTDLAYSNVVGTGSVLGGDGIVDAARANLNNYYPIGADTFTITSSSPLLHVDLLNRMNPIAQSIDEPGKRILSYQVDTSRYHFGHFNVLPASLTNPVDSDYYRLPVYENAELNFSVVNLAPNQVHVAVMDSAGTAIASGSSQARPNLHLNSIPLRAGIHYLSLSALANNETWQSPYAFRVDVRETGVCAGSIRVYDAGIPGNSYQWQVDNGSGFVPVINNTFFTGATSKQLTVSAAPTSWYGYRFRCLVNGSNFSTVYTLKFSSRWIGSVDNRWENPANWSCGVVPDEKTDVYVYAGAVFAPLVTANQACRSLQLRAGASITIQGNANLHLTGE